MEEIRLDDFQKLIKVLERIAASLEKLEKEPLKIKKIVGRKIVE